MTLNKNTNLYKTINKLVTRSIAVKDQEFSFSASVKPSDQYIVEGPDFRKLVDILGLRDPGVHKKQRWGTQSGRNI